MERWTQEPIKEILDQIDKDDHQERIVYLEEHAYLLGTLDDYDRNYCTYHYIHSLHAVERYDEVLTMIDEVIEYVFLYNCLLYTSPSPRDQRGSRMPSSA